MTVSYTGEVANASSFGCFNNILFKWKGSVYKLIYKVHGVRHICFNLTCLVQELLTYIFVYLLISLVYREVLVKNSEEEDPGLVSSKMINCVMLRTSFFSGWILGRCLNL